MSTLRSFNTRKNGKRFGLRSAAGLFLLLAATGLIWAATASQAANPPCPLVGNFEIDGDMLQGTCAPPGDDWNTSGLNVQTSTQGGTYNTNNKDADPTSGWTSGGGTPDKADFQRAYSFAKVVNGHYIVYLAWERTATSGTQSYNIELDNSDANVGADGTPQPNRSNGGAVFYIDAQGGGLPTFGSDCTFTSQSDYGSTCSNSQAGYTAAFNSVDIADPLNGNATVSAGGFDEIALDVTALTGIAPSCPGPSAASLYLRSATGTNHKNLKGYMAPFVLQPDSTCVPPPITTTATNGDNNTPSGLLNARGSTQFDTVTVGTAQTPGVGSVAFWLCTPANLTANGDCATGGVQVGSAKTLDLAGKATSDNVTGATTPNDNTDGKYCWRAVYTPGANNHNYLPGSDSNGDSSGVVGAECFTIVHKSPTIATQIALTGQNKPGLGFTTLGDTATLSGYAGNTDGETITFKLYGPFANGVTPVCDAGHLIAGATTTGTLSGGSATTSQTYKPTAAGTYVWIASYNGDSFNDGISGTCSDANESGTIVASQISVAKAANPGGPVSAGTDIGFDVTVSNPGSVPATGVHVTDSLPAGADGVAGGDLDWSLSPAYTGCSITGNPGNEALDCTFNQVDGNSSLPAIHISSHTAFADCGTVKNKASVSTTNGTGGDSNLATVDVLCPDISIKKTADHATVNVGSPIGFTVTAKNTGAGDATGALVDDPLPSGPGITWTIDAAGTSGPLTCGITADHLTCTGTLSSGATEVVHVTSPTEWTKTNGVVTNSCLGGPKQDGVYPNTATLTATNDPDSPSDNAQTQVLCPDLHITKTADAGTVNAGSDIGFTITASNTGAGDATGAVIADPLPLGPADVTWSIQSATGPLSCGISPGGNALSCNGTLASGQTETVHITAPTTFADCATYLNDATLTATNTPQSPDGGDSTTVNCPDLSIKKTADAQSVNVGSPIGFTVTAKNTGAGDATGVLVDDPLPSGPGITWTIDAAGTSGPLTCGIAAGHLTCTGTLKSGDTEIVHVTSPTSWTKTNGVVTNSCLGGPKQDGVYPNTATLTATNDPNSPSDSAQTEVLCPDLDITKAADAPSVNAGSPIGFTITATNTGPGDATGALIDDPLPAGPAGVTWSIQSATGPLTCGGAAAGHLTCTGTLGAGQTETVHITAQTTFADCATYNNTAALTAGNTPQAPSDGDSTTVDCPDLSIKKTADAPSVNVGSPIGFTVTASNTGNGDATGVLIDDPLPSGPGITWTIDGAGTSGPLTCHIVAGTLSCTGTLAAGKTEIVHLTSPTEWTKTNGVVTNSCLGGPKQDGVYPNTATLTATNDPNSHDDSAQTEVLCPDLSITKKADAAAVNAGTDIGFTITATNNGAGDATGALIDDTLPAGPAGATWSIDAANTSGPLSCGITAGHLTCTGTLGAGQTETVHITAPTKAADCATYDNTATLTAGNTPQAPSDGDSTQVLCADVVIQKTADAASVSVGSDIGFTVTVTNNGQGSASGVDVEDPLPTGPVNSGISWSIDAGGTSGPLTCSITAGTLSCTGSLASGATETVHVTSHTVWNSDHKACGTYDNTATVTWNLGPNVPISSNQATEDVLCPDVAIAKTADEPTVSAGTDIGFTVDISNAGPGTATAVTVSDPLPGGPADIDWSISPVYAGPGTCTINGLPGTQTLDCSLGDLAPKADVVVHIKAATKFADCAVYDNTATAHAANEPGIAPGSDSTTVQCPDVSLTKTADNASVDAGDPIGFTITVSNSSAPGTGSAVGVTLKDTPLPTGTVGGWTIEHTTIPNPGTCSISPAGDELDCTAVDLAPGDSYEVHIVAATDAQNCTTYDNTATASQSFGPDATDSASIECNTGQVVITKTADHSAPVNAGDPIGFTVEIKNTGKGRVTGAVLNDALPAGSGSGVTWAIDPAVGTPAQFVLAGAKGAQTLTLASSTLPAGADYKVHITAATSQTECSGTYDNTATLTTSNANNPSPASAHEACAYRVDLSVTKAGSPATQDLGAGNITWTIVVTNNGPDTDTGVTIADPMPGGNTFVSASSTQGTCTGGAVLNCNIGTMAAGATVTITLVTTPSAAGAQTNTVAVAGARPETNTTNNTATATVQITAPFVPPPVYCVAVSKITPNQLFVGRKTTLTIHLTKHGRPASGVKVRIKGPKLNLTTERSNARGIVKQVIKMKKAGIDTFTPLASKRCNTKRVGVTGVFTPPVTG